MDDRKRFEEWCSNPYFDEETRKELEAVAGDEEEIRDRFYRDLEFGTGGLRGVIGAGTNRMNRYTVRKATQGLANYMLKQNGAELGVAIAYDSRCKSEVFALEAAACLNGNGIHTYLYSRLTPTPMLSYAVRRLGCMAGIVITASHNPAEYNGYKVYWADGAQITAPRDREIIGEVQNVTDFRKVNRMDMEEAKKQGLFHLIDDEMEEAYLEDLKKLVLHPEAISQMASRLKIVYTPLHGTGNRPVQKILAKLGFEQIYVVREQQEPDGAFPTVSCPNPEDSNAFAMALKLAQEVDADLVLATDPDADRLGVYAKDAVTGEYHSFTGNMSGVMLCHYLLSQRKSMGILPKNGAVVKTIVTSRMAEPVAAEFGMKLVEVLTGFKYIGEQIKYFEEQGTYSYQFGFEESYGCLVESCVRDKDAVSAVMSLCEAAAYYASKGSSLWEQMMKLYERYGYYREGLVTKTLKGAEGAERIRIMMEQMRANPPRELGRFAVEEIADYQSGIIRRMVDGTERSTGLPVSNVLRYSLAEDAWCCMRPSGTEPKIKYYFGVKGASEEDAQCRLEALKASVLRFGESHTGS